MSAIKRLAMVLAALAIPLPAKAQTTEERARALFDEGLAAEQQGDAAGACERFRQSLALVRELGPLRKAKDCNLAEKKLLAARANLKELLGQWTGDAEQRGAFERELEAIEARLARVSITLAAGATPPARVTLDGQAVTLPASGVELDPGEHEVVYEASDQRIKRTAILLAEGESKSIEITEPQPEVAPPRPPPPAEQAPTGLGITGFVVGGVGVLGFGAATLTGVMVLDKRDELDACQTQGCRDTAASEGDTLLVVNGIMWGVGIVGVGLGAALVIADYATAPEEAPGSAELTLRVGPGGFTLDGTF